ncbi:phospholipase D-like domain-containing protein [Bordetella petrii]|uniref:phospholipase D-like domain-containing protein n=1 Tax=Bordetella petrii TaxID=94624 RepID=UPI001E3D7759|nr:phospholipase D-like domain-containing protein [Bordetella petrii]MCD0504022.1 phospholipase D-like domain-containing protein [Bordetella petrii]
MARDLWRAARLAPWLVLAAMLAACATVPDAQEREARKQQAGRSADTGWSSYQKGRDIVAHADADAQGAQDFHARHRAIEAAISGAPLVPGNQVRLLSDGPSTYRAMLEAIDGARQYVHMETYIFEDDEEGQRFADALIAAHRRGAAVAVMIDAVGTLGTPDALFDRMRDAGVQVAVFNPVNPAEARTGWSPNQRNHRKLLVVDGKVGFLGGINVSSVYSSGSRPAKNAGEAQPWRDTHIRIAGPAVAELERVILKGWASQKGPPMTPREFFPRIPPQGDLTVRILANQPDRSDGYTVYLTLMSAFESAQKSIHITMAYFVPDPAFVQALQDAARRGVDVVLVLPGFSDSSLVFHAGRSHYDGLLKAGAKIYERRDALLHAKTVVVDGVWSTVGSSNMDWRSFALNYEINAVILGPDFGAEMEALFERDVADAEPVTLQAWQGRGADDRFMEFFSRLFERWL